MPNQPTPTAEPLENFSNLGVIEYRLGILERGLADHRLMVEKRFADGQVEARLAAQEAIARHKEIDDKVTSLVSWKDRWEGRIQAFGLILILLTAVNTILNIMGNLKP
jgi:hypothetical protein